MRRRAKKWGAPPGSLIYTGDRQDKTATLSLILYSSENYIEKYPQTIEEAFREIQPGYKVWLHVEGINQVEVIEAIGKHFKLHPLLLEDIMNPSQRSKLDDYKEHLYMVTRLLKMTHEEDFHFDDEQISLVMGPSFLITFLEKNGDPLKIIREGIYKPNSKIRTRGIDYLAYTILDMIVDSYFLVLEKADHSLEQLEVELLDNPSPKTLKKIRKNKHFLILLKKAIWPMREMLNHFRRIDSPLVLEATRVYAYDVYDHTIQAIETVEEFSDTMSDMLDIYISAINQRTNEIMKVLTIVSTIFVPLTFISSIYGMNFDYMPELHSRFGYPLVLTVMFLISLCMLYLFRRKRWI